jgi:V8-like Glu-specific endopeptidase
MTKVTKVDEFSYFAAIGYKKEDIDKSIEYLCGGTLIAEDIVLGVAHCFRGRFNPVVVKLGAVSIEL